MESTVCVRDSSASPPSSLVAPVAVKPNMMNDGSPLISHAAAAAAAVEQQRFQQLYQLALAERLRLASNLAWPRVQPHFDASTNPSQILQPPTLGGQPNMLAAAAAAGHSYMYPWRFVDPRSFYRVPEEPKPQHSYIGLIAMAILSSAERKLVLSDIYNYILENYAYFRSRGPGWRNSIRHNLSLNDCFIKSGRSANGKGHYWAIHPANVDDFSRGDFRRRRAQRRVRKHLGLQVDDDSSPEPSPSSPVHSQIEPRRRLSDSLSVDDVLSRPPSLLLPSPTTSGTRKRQFDVASLLAPDDHGHNSIIKSRRCLPDISTNSLVVPAPSVCDNLGLSHIRPKSPPDHSSHDVVLEESRSWSILGWGHGHPWTILTPPQEENETESTSHSPSFQEVSEMKTEN